MNKSVLIAGGSGSVGRHLATFLEEKGFFVKSLSRNRKRCDGSDHYVYWDSDRDIFELGNFIPHHVVNLSGAGIADQKWSEKRKKIIIESRTKCTNFLINSLKNRDIHTESFISASAVGYYGHTGDQIAKETDNPHTNEFLSQVCEVWEKAASAAHEITNQLTIVRISTVLMKDAGALEKMDKTIPFGMANYLGNGKQYLPWIHIADLCGFIHHSLMLSGNSSEIYNIASPDEVTNYQFTEILRDVINPKSLLLPAPKLSLKLLLGEMSRVVLNSTRVTTDKIKSIGYDLRFPKLKKALEDIYQD